MVPEAYLSTPSVLIMEHVPGPTLVDAIHEHFESVAAAKGVTVDELRYVDTVGRVAFVQGTDRERERECQADRERERQTQRETTMHAPSYIHALSSSACGHTRCISPLSTHSLTPPPPENNK